MQRSRTQEKLAKQAEVNGASEVVEDFDNFGKQVGGECQCLENTLRSYLDVCLEIITTFDAFTITHMPRERNDIANILAQQASGYRVVQFFFFLLVQGVPGEVFGVKRGSIGNRSGCLSFKAGRSVARSKGGCSGHAFHGRAPESGCYWLLFRLRHVSSRAGDI